MGLALKVPAHVFDSVKTLVDSIRTSALGALDGIRDSAFREHVRRHGFLRIQRRWVADTLPEHELLDAVAIAYGKVAEVVHDAHRQMGLDPSGTIHDDAGNPYNLAAMGWRLPCMIGHEMPRSLLISLADGSRLEAHTKSVPMKFDGAAITSALERYGASPFEAMSRDYETDVDLAAGYFAMVRSVFLRDGYHVTALFLFRERKPVRLPIQVVVEDVQQKYAVMRQLAVEVTKTGADAAILISEAWGVPADQLKPYERPTDSPDRTEMLTLHMVCKSGTSFDFQAEILRDGDKVSLGETHVADQGFNFAFAPFFEAWDVPLPGT